MEEVIRRVVQGDHPSFKEDGHITGEWWGWGREGRGAIYGPWQLGEEFKEGVG